MFSTVVSWMKDSWMDKEDIRHPDLLDIYDQKSYFCWSCWESRAFHLSNNAWDKSHCKVLGREKKETSQGQQKYDSGWPVSTISFHWFPQVSSACAWMAYIISSGRFRMKLLSFPSQSFSSWTLVNAGVSENHQVFKLLRETGYKWDDFTWALCKSPKMISEERDLKLHGLVFHFDFFFFWYFSLLFLSL